MPIAHGNFAYKLLKELHHSLFKRLFIGFACTSDYDGPKKPNDHHHLIQEIDYELPITKPTLQLTYKIFGSSSPILSNLKPNTMTILVP